MTPTISVHSGCSDRKNSLIGMRPPFLIGVAGGTASGKTTVCKRLMESLGQNKRSNLEKQVVSLSQDSFYRELSPTEIVKANKGMFNFDHPDAFDNELMESVLQVFSALEELFHHQLTLKGHHPRKTDKNSNLRLQNQCKSSRRVHCHLSFRCGHGGRHPCVLLSKNPRAFQSEVVCGHWCGHKTGKVEHQCIWKAFNHYFSGEFWGTSKKGAEIWSMYFINTQP